MNHKVERLKRQTTLGFDFLGGCCLILVGYELLEFRSETNGFGGFGIVGSLLLLSFPFLVAVITMVLVAVSKDLSIEPLLVGIVLSIGGVMSAAALMVVAARSLPSFLNSATLYLLAFSLFGFSCASLFFRTEIVRSRAMRRMRR